MVFLLENKIWSLNQICLQVGFDTNDRSQMHIIVYFSDTYICCLDDVLYYSQPIENIRP